MIKIFVSLLFLLLSLMQAEAVQPSSPQCHGLDSTTFSTTGTLILMACTVTAGPSGNIFVMATAETKCLNDEKLQLIVGSGSSPVTGASFTATIASNVLNVSTMATGSGTAPFTIQPGQILFDNGGGVAASVTIGAYGSGGTTGTGTTGTYTLIGTQPNISSPETMFTAIAPPGGTTAISNALKQTQCSTGVRMQSIAGGYTGTPGATYWIGMLISSLSGTWVNWNNNYMVIFSY